MGEYITITSRSNPVVCSAASLSEKKFRDRERMFLFDGIKLFREAAACRMPLEYVLVREDKKDVFIPEINASAPGVSVYVLGENAFDKVSGEKAPEGIVSVSKYIDNLHKSYKIEKDGSESDIVTALKNAGTVIALESVRDPGNVGTVIRTAAAFGIDTVLMSSDCADIYNSKTVRAAMGALFSRKVLITDNLSSALSELKAMGRKTYATALMPGALKFGEFTLSSSDVFVIGNEGHGLSESIIKNCDAPVFIPMMTGPGVESLNAATAASVIMYELFSRAQKV